MLRHHVVGMDKDEDPETLRCRPKGVELPLIEVLPVDVREDRDSTHVELVDRSFEFTNRQQRELKRNMG